MQGWANERGLSPLPPAPLDVPLPDPAMSGRIRRKTGEIGAQVGAMEAPLRVSKGARSLHEGWKWSACRWEIWGACEGAGDWEQGHRDMRMEARGSHRMIKDAQSSGAINATEEKAND